MGDSESVCEFKCPPRPIEGIRSPGSGVKAIFEVTDKRVQELNPGPLEEQQVSALSHRAISPAL